MTSLTSADVPSGSVTEHELQEVARANATTAPTSRLRSWTPALATELGTLGYVVR
jgi:hypothetical protein